MEQYLVECHGEEDLMFTGELLASARESAAHGTPNLWELRLFRTSARGYVLSAAFHIAEQGNRSLNTAWLFADREDLEHFVGQATPPHNQLMAELLAKAAQHDTGLCSLSGQERNTAPLEEIPA